MQKIDPSELINELEETAKIIDNSNKDIQLKVEGKRKYTHCMKLKTTKKASTQMKRIKHYQKRVSQ